MNIQRQPSQLPILRLRFKGDAIHDGHILYNDLADFVSNFGAAIDRVLNSLQTGTSSKKGRPLKSSQLLGALEIVSVRHRSFAVDLDLRRNGHPFLPMWDLGEHAIDIVVRGFENASKGRPLPEECDSNVLIPMREAGVIFERGIDSVQINCNSSFGSRRVKYSPIVRESIIKQLRRTESAYGTVEGRLLWLDVTEDKLRCQLQPSTGSTIWCKFDEALVEQIIKNIRGFVQARGEVSYDAVTNKLESIYIKDLESIEETMAQGNTLTPISSFWKGKTFDELAIEQKIYPLEDIRSLSSDWPEDTDFDSFFDAVRSARQ